MKEIFGKTGDLFDVSEITLKILSCIYRSKEKYGAFLIASCLCGRKNKKVEEFGLEKLSTFGIAPEFTVIQVKAIIYELVRRCFLYRSMDYDSLKIADKGKQFLKQKPELFLSKQILENAKSPMFSTKLLPTHFQTLILWEKGLSAPEIAKTRNFKETTIEDQLAELVFHKKIIDISLLVSKEKEKIIRDALPDDLKSVKLKPIKEKLGDNITYGQIKIVIANL